MTTDFTRQWIQFFTECGIPEDVATTYGLIFNENRIQKNMLLDLNKEYLRDMGITIMGDIIAILRHAKVVHDRYVKEQVLFDSEKKKIVKKKIKAPTMGCDNLVSVKPAVPVSNMRRALPEIEGNYKIKMPSGTTERSKKLLEKAKLKQSKTVFDRLGESSVSSTSDVTTTVDTTEIVKPLASKEKNFSSVFDRLGEKSSLVTSTSSNSDSTVDKEDVPYYGILKKKRRKKILTYSAGSTMRADNELKKSQVNDTKMRTKNLKERLGTRVEDVLSTSQNDTLKFTRVRKTTFEDKETEPSDIKTVSTIFKSTNVPSGGKSEEKKAFDCLNHHKPQILRNKSRVSSTTQLRESNNRGVKRRFDNGELVDSKKVDVPMKKVRFGGTTQRLIPRSRELTGASNKITMISGNEMTRKKKLNKLTLSSGVTIGPMNSDKISKKLSLKERIGCMSMSSESDRIGIKLKQKNLLNFKNKPISVHDRLG